MYEAAVFDPNAALSGQFNTQLPINGKFVAFNESNVGINIIFSNGDTRYLSAWNSDKFTLPTKTPIVQWSQKVVLLGTTNPISQVLIEAYQPNETIDGTFPAPIQHTSYIPNVVSTAMGGSLSVQNDGNTPGTQVYESTVSGSPGSNVIMQNQGLVEVLQWIGGVLTQIFKTDPGAASVVKLGNTGLTTESLGNMTVDQALSVIGNTSLSTLATSALATLNSLSVTNNATVGGTLGVTGKATLGSAEVSTTLKVDTTSEFVGNATFDANPILTNAVPLQAKDNGGNVRNVLQVDSNNNVQLFGIAGLDLIQALDHSGNLATIIDLVHKSFDIKTTAVNVVGTTNGNATGYEFLTGTNVKALLIYFNAYRNASVTSQILTLPVAFTAWAQWLAGNGPFINPRLSGSNLSNACRVLTTLASGGGTNTATSLLPPKSLGEIIQGFDSFDLGNSQGTNNSSVYFFIGQ